MRTKIIRAAIALVLALAAGSVGYIAGDNGAIAVAGIPAQTVSAPAAGSVRVIYSLDQKQNDKEIIALIDAAKSKIYFAIYTFTLPSIADALIAAKDRGVAVYGIVDGGQAESSYGAPIIKKLVDAAIPIVAEKHATGSGIMHIKALVTDSAYVSGSYNWTRSGTTINDEIIEIGTDPTLRQIYEDILRKLFEAYRNNPVSSAEGTGPVSVGTINYTEAAAHVGVYASVRGSLVEAYTSKTGTVFLNFCKNYKSCTFAGVIFADDANKFGDLSRYVGSTITLTGKISSYKGRAEIILSKPNQLSK